MPGLALKLAPNERVLINGAVIENGPRRTRLTICTANAAVLRLRDALHPDDVVGPVSRTYYCAQLAVAGEMDVETATTQLRERLAELRDVFRDAPQIASIDDATAQLRERDFYRVMRALKDMLDVERTLIGEQATS